MSDRDRFFELAVEDGAGRLIKFDVRTQSDPDKELYRIVDKQGKDSSITTEFKSDRRIDFVIVAILLVEDGAVYSYEYKKDESAVYFGKLVSLVPTYLPRQ